MHTYKFFTTTHCTSEPWKTLSPQIITENMDWGNISLIFHRKQQRLYVFCAGTWIWHLGMLRTVLCPKLEHAAPTWGPYCETQIQQVEKVHTMAVRWTSRRWRNTSSVDEMLNELQWPTLEAARDLSSRYFSSTRFIEGLCLFKSHLLGPI